MQPKFSLIDQEQQNDQCDRREHQTEHIRLSDKNTTDIDRTDLEQLWELLEFGFPYHICQVLVGRGKSHGCDHQKHIRGTVVTDPAVCHTLIQKADDRRAANTNHTGKPERDRIHLRRHKAYISAQHAHLSVCPVGKIQQAVYKRVAGSDQRINAPDRDSGDDLLQQNFHCSVSLLSVFILKYIKKCFS